MPIIKLILYIFILASYIGATPVLIADNDDYISLNGHYSYLVDSSNIWLNGDAIGFKEFNTEFKEVVELSPSFKITLPKTIWVKSTIMYKGVLPKQFVLSTDAAYIDIFNLYIEKNGKVIDSLITTETSKLNLSVLTPAITLNLLPNDTIIIYNRYSDEAPVPLMLSIKTTDKFYKIEMLKGMFVSFFYGVIIILLAYNAVLYFTLRQNSLLYYGFYLIGNLIFQMSLDGTLQRIFLIGSPYWITNRILFGSICLLSSFLMTFSRELLKLADRFPKLDKMMYWFSQIFWIELILLVIIPNMSIVADYIAVSFALSTSIAMYVGIRSIKPFNSTALYYTLAFIPFILGGTLIVFRFVGLVPASFITENGVQIGSGFEVFFFTLSLMSHIKRLQNETNLERDKKVVESQKLKNLNSQLRKFIPEQFLSYLGFNTLSAVKLGDCIEKEMSILFCDIRQFTNLSEALTPDENFKFLNSYLVRMEPQIIKNNGFIDKYIGDAIMALFESSDDAVRAGLDILKELKVYNTHRAKSGYIPISLGVGINTGNLMLGIIGGDNRMETTVIGDTVNLASRIEKLTKRYSTPLLISRKTLFSIKNKQEFATRYIDNVKVAGKNIETEIFEVFNMDDEIVREDKIKYSNLFSKGLRYSKTGKKSEALKIFKEITQNCPHDSSAAIHLKSLQSSSRFNNN